MCAQPSFEVKFQFRCKEAYSTMERVKRVPLAFSNYNATALSGLIRNFPLISGGLLTEGVRGSWVSRSAFTGKRVKRVKLCWETAADSQCKHPFSLCSVGITHCIVGGS